MSKTNNEQVADALREAGDLLEQQAANRFRIRAYRRAADTVAGLDEDLHAIIARAGIKGLVALPHIGTGIAGAIGEILSTGRWTQLERLRGTVEPDQLFQSVPGIGPTLAKRLNETLGVDTIPALDNAAREGRLEEVPGVGSRRAAAISAALERIVGHSGFHTGSVDAAKPKVDLLIKVDRDYRDRVAAGSLPMIAPRRFNPNDEAWLPIMHTQRANWHFTVLFSNTALAHELNRTHDWVLIYYYDEHHVEGQCTVVTETRGALTGRRVIRGREREC